jgi:hypothetical protein
LKTIVTFCMQSQSGEYFPVEYRHPEYIPSSVALEISLEQVKAKHSRHNIVDYRVEKEKPYVPYKTSKTLRKQPITS